MVCLRHADGQKTHSKTPRSDISFPNNEKDQTHAKLWNSTEPDDKVRRDLPHSSSRRSACRRAGTAASNCRAVAVLFALLKVLWAVVRKGVVSGTGFVALAWGLRGRTLHLPRRTVLVHEKVRWRGLFVLGLLSLARKLRRHEYARRRRHKRVLRMRWGGLLRSHVTVHAATAHLSHVTIAHLLHGHVAEVHGHVHVLPVGHLLLVWHHDMRHLRIFI